MQLIIAIVLVVCLVLLVRMRTPRRRLAAVEQDIADLKGALDLQRRDLARLAELIAGPLEAQQAFKVEGAAAPAREETAQLHSRGAIALEQQVKSIAGPLLQPALATARISAVSETIAEEPISPVPRDGVSPLTAEARSALDEAAPEIEVAEQAEALPPPARHLAPLRARGPGLWKRLGTAALIVRARDAIRTELGAKSGEPVDWEALVGGKWLNLVGMLVLVVGMALLTQFAWTRLPPVGRIAMGTGLGGVLLVGGIFGERLSRYRLIGRTLIGGGWGDCQDFRV